MRKFIEKALSTLPKLNNDQIRSVIKLISSENELLEMVLGSIPEGMIVCNTEHRIIFSNKHIERMVGLGGGERADRIIWELIRDKDIALFVRKALQNQERIEDHDFVLGDGGENTIVSCSLYPLVSRGSIQGSVFLVEDVTEKRNNDAKLRRAESLAALTTLAAGVAHEIKNPLGSMGIHVQLIQKMMNKNGEPNRETIGEYLGVINEEIERLNGIVVDFLFAVRPMDAHPEEEDLNKIILDLINFMHYELEEEDVDYAMELDRELPSLMLDERFIKQALLNIIKNAVYAMKGGGTLKLSTEHKGDQVLLVIEDNGTGIPDEVKRKIFEPYFTTKHSGSGLGLTLVFKILKEHGADIEVNSKEGEGTAFYIRFPVQEKYKKMLEWEGKNDEV